MPVLVWIVLLTAPISIRFTARCRQRCKPAKPSVAATRGEMSADAILRPQPHAPSPIGRVFAPSIATVSASWPEWSRPPCRTVSVNVAHAAPYCEPVGTQSCPRCGPLRASRSSVSDGIRTIPARSSGRINVPAPDLSSSTQHTGLSRSCS
jgi:hypothetical protein